MALSDDQRKLLKLLANQDEAYEAIAAATGASVEDLKAKAAGAIRALDEEAREERPRDGGGRPAGPVAAGDPPPLPVAKASSGAVPPTTPPAGDMAGQTGEARRRSAGSGSSGPSWLPGNRRLAELLGGALVVLLLILFATGAIDIGGGDDEDGGDAPAAALDGQLPASAVKQTPQAVLEAVDGSEANGRALFGRFKQQVVLLLAVKQLEPSPAGQSYAISLAKSDDERIPIAAAPVGEAGTLSGQFQLPPNVLGLLASGYDQMEVSLVVNKELEAALREAQGAKSAPDFGGEDVLSGPVTGRIVELGEEGG